MKKREKKKSLVEKPNSYHAEPRSPMSPNCAKEKKSKRIIRRILYHKNWAFLQKSTKMRDH